MTLPPGILEALIRSLAIASVVAGVAGLGGITLAWLVARTDLPGGRWLSGLLSVPYAIPAYLLAMAWVVLGNPTVGLLRAWLPAGGSYGFWGIVCVESTVAFAFPYLELKAGFDKIDPALEEAARMSGAGPLRVFTDVSFPLLKPALLNGMLLAFLYAISSFGVPALLGMPARQLTLTTLIYSQIKLGGARGIKAGFALSGLLLAIAVAVLALSAWAGARSRRPSLSGGKSSRPSQVRLGPPARAAGALAAWGFFAVAVLVPWAALGISALAPVAGRYDPSLWTLSHLEYVLGLPDFKEALLNSLFLSVLMASAVAGGGFALGYLAVRRRGTRAGRLAHAWVMALGVPFATPGTVLAMGILFVAVVCARLGVPVNEPMLMMAAAYGIKYAAVGARSMVLGFSQVDGVLEEAARVSGASTGELLRTIWLPLLKGSLGAAFALAWLPMATELTMSVLLTGPGAATLGTVLFDLQEYADQPSAAALAWLLLSAALVISLLSRVREGQHESA